MWLVLLCLSGQSGHCDDNALARARATQWRAEAAFAGEPNELGSMSNQWTTIPEDWNGIDGAARYATQRECLAALRRMLPVRQNIDERGYVTEVEHGRDFVRQAEYYIPPPTPVGISEYGCFFEGPYIS